MAVSSYEGIHLPQDYLSSVFFRYGDMKDNAGRTLALMEPDGRMDDLDNARHRIGSHQMCMEWNWRCGTQRGWAGKGARNRRCKHIKEVDFLLLSFRQSRTGR